VVASGKADEEHAMTSTRDDFLATARSAADLLREPAIAAAWNTPSALEKFSVAGLAGHTAYQILSAQQALAEPTPTLPTISLLEHYGRVQWIDAGLDDEINVRIRHGGEEVAAGGPAALLQRVDAALTMLLDDLLVTRMMELVVHCDDLAVSVGIATPTLPQSAVDTVIALLSRLAVRRHGQTAVLRALSRAERAPDTITAF
jgi:hypothetical protein